MALAASLQSNTAGPLACGWVAVLAVLAVLTVLAVLAVLAVKGCVLAALAVLHCARCANLHLVEAQRHQQVSESSFQEHFSRAHVLPRPDDVMHALSGW